jgi:hypothetical protein
VSRAGADALKVRPFALIAVLAAFAAGCGEAAPEREAAAPPRAEKEQSAAMAPLPTPRPKLVTPVAGKTSNAGQEDRLAGTVSADDSSLPEPTGPASDSEPRGASDGVENLSATKATALPNGIALPPLEAPEPVLDVIRAGNIIARSPYKWGGGHGRWQDTGYDCSGSVSYALYYAGLVDGPSASGGYMTYGEPGPGKWITIYTNPGHMYMVVAGIRFDTVGRAETGSRWQNDLGSAPGSYVVRHPPGL